MRDYKHVKVPRKYRSSSSRTVVKRVEVGGGRERGPKLRDSLGTALAVLLVLGFTYGAWATYQWLTHAEVFQIAGVDVKGVRRVSDDEIKAIAGVFTGQNVFKVALDSATRRAAANPWVKDVRIERRLPNRISMVIAERVPFAVLEAANGRFLIDDEGVVIIPAGKGSAEADRLPTVALRDHRAALREQTAAGGVPEALELLTDLATRGGWNMGAVKVKADSPESIAIVYADHEFRIGSGNYAEKLRRLGEIVADMKQRNLTFAYVELRPERQAAVMVKQDRRGTRDEGRRTRKNGNSH